jgi:hypothetical protein
MPLLSPFLLIDGPTCACLFNPAHFHQQPSSAHSPLSPGEIRPSGLMRKRPFSYRELLLHARNFAAAMAHLHSHLHPGTEPSPPPRRSLRRLYS